MRAHVGEEELLTSFRYMACACGGGGDDFATCLGQGDTHPVSISEVPRGGHDHAEISSHRGWQSPKVTASCQRGRTLKISSSRGHR